MHKKYLQSTYLMKDLYLEYKTNSQIIRKQTNFLLWAELCFLKIHLLKL